MLWRNSVPFDETDPFFRRDLGFYIFDLAWWLVVGLTMAVAIVSFIAATFLHYLYAASGSRRPATGPGAAAGRL